MGEGKRRYNWTKIITWAIILLVSYVIWFKMVPGAFEYVMGQRKCNQPCLSVTYKYNNIWRYLNVYIVGDKQWWCYVG